ncbi:MAG TPA: outer-membrane lipoprotein carrier protein LolA [Rectinemataceae bacterium]|nr:outer-membrane lipoprotein carrier protein LolA [Rectinemataceae bacterium]
MRAIFRARPSAAALCAAFAFLTLGLPAFSQATATEVPQVITTAEQYFQEVSSRYAQVTDYSCKISISSGKTSMSGNLIYRAASLLRIDFSEPAGQVISYDGQTLQVYIPEYHAVLSQSVTPTSGVSAAGLATRDGLNMMRRNYGIAFESNPDPVELAGTTEKVIRLVLTRKTVAEGFKTIVMSVSPESKLIRRLEGTTLANETFTFDFTGIKLNQNIPESRFIYNSPASANVYNNFLFNSTDTGN